MAEKVNLSDQPYIWLQEKEESGLATCGCVLKTTGPGGIQGPAFYQCPLHEATREILEALKGLIQKDADGAAYHRKFCPHSYPPRQLTEECTCGVAKAERLIARMKTVNVA